MQFPLPPINVPVLINNIFYEFDRATLTEESTLALDSLVVMMNENPSVTIELAAHCDYKGDDAYNQRLSQRRAESVVNYLIAHGIKADRLSPVGYGESRPKVVRRRLAETYPFLHEGDTLTEAYIMKLKDDEQEICNAINRRTEFRVLRTTYGTTLQETVTEEPKAQPMEESPTLEAGKQEAVEEVDSTSSSQAETKVTTEPEAKPEEEPEEEEVEVKQEPVKAQEPVKQEPAKAQEPVRVQEQERNRVVNVIKQTTTDDDEPD